MFDHLQCWKGEYKVKHAGENLKYPPTILTRDAVEIGNAKVQYEIVTSDNKPKGEKVNINQSKMENATTSNNPQFWVSNVNMTA